jgi:hypothetical protein
MQPYKKYTDLALKLKDLKDNTTNITKLGEIFNNYLDQKLESFLYEERTPNENDFKTIEMKYLLEMSKTISYYEEIISILDQLIANPDFAQWHNNFFDLRVQYTKRLNKLHIV